MRSRQRRCALAIGAALALVGPVRGSIQRAPAVSQAAAAETTASAASSPAEADGSSSAGSGSGSGEAAETADSGEGTEGGDAATRTVSAPPPSPAERIKWLAKELDAAVAARPALIGAKIGCAAVDVAAGTPLWNHQGEAPLSLASTTKLFTAASALSRLGPGYVWRTALYGGEDQDATPEELRDGTLETLYLRGRGDPTLEYSALRSLARDLADRGINRVSKELVIDASFFDDDAEPPHFIEQPKERAAFRAPVTGLQLGRNAVTIIATTAPDGTQPPKVRLDPPVAEYFKLITDELVTTTEGKTRVRVDVVPKKTGRDKKEFELRVSGQLRADGPGFYRRIRVDDPLAFAAAALRTALAEQGIRAPAKVSFGPVPPTAKLYAAFDSPTLAEVIRRMNKTSDNFLAETVWKTTGAETRAEPGPATWADAAAASAAFLAKLALPSPMRIDNGSGLFDASSASASQLVALLAAVHRDFRIAPDFVASLPVGGIDGTLQSRFRKRAALGLVRAKTGTLAQVSSLAGFVGVDAAHPIAFAILTNNLTPAQKGEARALQEDLVEILALYAGAPPLAPGAVK